MPLTRAATILASAATVAVIAVLFALGVSRGAASEPPCGARAASVWADEGLRVAERIRDEELAGPTVSRAMRSVSSDAALARAVAAGDLAGIHRQIGVLLYNHEHIVRIRILDASRAALADVGGRHVLSPLHGLLRTGGRVVGAFVISVQDDMGYRLLVQRLVGAQSVMRTARGRTVMASIRVGTRALPAAGAVAVRGREYLVRTVEAERFPAGPLHVSLLFPRPGAGLATVSCAQIRADVLSAIARRVYLEARTGPAAVIARSAVGASRILPAAVLAGNVREARRSAQRLRAGAHIARVLVLRPDGSVLADVGDRRALIEPNRIALHRAGGAIIARVVVSVQSVHGFIGVAGYLTKTTLVVRDGARTIGGAADAPASLPASGPLTWNGVLYHVSSFRGALYPAGEATVYSLDPGY